MSDAVSFADMHVLAGRDDAVTLSGPGDIPMQQIDMEGHPCQRRWQIASMGDAKVQGGAAGRAPRETKPAALDRKPSRTPANGIQRGNSAAAAEDAGDKEKERLKKWGQPTAAVRRRPPPVATG